MRCILAYIYRCLNNYEQALFYLDEAIDLKERNERNPIAWYVRGEINFRQCYYNNAIENLKTSISYGAKINNLYIILGNSYLDKVEINYEKDGYLYFALK